MTGESHATHDQVTSLLRLVEGLSAKVEANTVTLAEHRADFRTMRGDMDRVRNDVSAIHKYIHTGNGRESLATRVLVNERTLLDITAKESAKEQSENDDRRARETVDRQYQSSLRLALITSGASMLGVILTIIYSIATSGAS
jgi:hypothetical protein